MFENVAGTWTNPVELNGTGSQGGRSVSISGDVAVVGAPRSTVDGLWAGSADVFARAGTDWLLTDTVSASDREFGDAFGGERWRSTAPTCSSAPPTTPTLDGVLGGAAYVYTVAAPENPTIDFTLAVTSDPSVKVVDGGIPAASFSAPVLEENATNTTSLAAAPLAGIELEDTPLAGIAVGDTPLAGIVINSSPLAGIPLIDVDVEVPAGGGWPALVAGTDLENVPLVDLTFGEALGLRGRDGCVCRCGPGRGSAVGWDQRRWHATGRHPVGRDRARHDSAGGYSAGGHRPELVRHRRPRSV